MHTKMTRHTKERKRWYQNAQWLSQTKGQQNGWRT